MEEHTHQDAVKQLEDQLRQYAHAFAYPPTPALRKIGPGVPKMVVRKRSNFRRVAWGATVAFVLVALLLSVPGVRAQILEFIQMGVVRIFLVEPTAAPTTMAAPTSTLLPADLVRSLQDLAGEISLSDAPGQVDYPVLLPEYPEGIGEPQHVFVQNLGAPVLILIWMNPDQPDQTLFSLSTIPPGSFAMDKSKPSSTQYTTVGGQPAIWAVGPYIIQIKNGDMDLRRLVDGACLIWVKDGITYRLETTLSMVEAIKIAESLQPYQP